MGFPFLALKLDFSARPKKDGQEVRRESVGGSKERSVTVLYVTYIRENNTAMK